MSDFTMGVVRLAGRSTVRGLLADLVLRLHEMMRARTTRRMLREMDDRMLSDIGLGRGDALVEAGRPMWDLGKRRR